MRISQTGAPSSSAFMDQIVRSKKIIYTINRLHYCLGIFYNPFRINFRVLYFHVSRPTKYVPRPLILRIHVMHVMCATPWPRGRVKRHGPRVILVGAMVRCYHAYKDVWAAVHGEELPCQREVGNRFDSFAVAIMRDETVVSHVPKISSVTSLYLRRAAGLRGRRQ